MTKEGILLGTVPVGSTLELQDDGTVFAFLPDGSAKRFHLELTPTGPLPVVDNVPPIKISFGK